MSYNSALATSQVDNSIDYRTNKYVTLGGDAFGIKMYTTGVIIIEVSDVVVDGQTYTPAKKANLKVNDVILEANGHSVTSNEELGELVKKSEDKPINLLIKRDDKTFNTTLTPIKDTEGNLRAGIWVRDSSAGIGTVTFYDTDQNFFASLGHGICDSSTGILLPLSRGDAVKATITGINKGQKGVAGGLNGFFTNEILGSILYNSEYGVYGSMENNVLTARRIEISSPNEVKAGKVKIVSTIDNQGPKFFDAEIEYIEKSQKTSTKNFIIKIIDENLLAATGGIVQGMSGSPIIQNGKLVGAVTHVFINEPDKGFGIYAINMLENYENYKNIMQRAVA